MFSDLFELLIATPLPQESRPSRTDWSDVTQRLGTELPTDYKELITTLGVGCINEFVYILSPFSSFQNLEHAVYRSRTMHARFVETLGVDDITYPIFPKPGGLLPWGSSWDDDTFHWITNGGDPDSWPVFVEGRYGERGEYPLTMTEFLVESLRGEIALPDIFPDGTLDVPAEYFTPPYSFLRWRPQ
jgi:hypothetical protein